MKMFQKSIFGNVSKNTFANDPKTLFEWSYLVPAMPARRRTHERTKMTSSARRTVNSILLKNSIFGT